jgi:hypothetical protein
MLRTSLEKPVQFRFALKFSRGREVKGVLINLTGAAVYKPVADLIEF